MAVDERYQNNLVITKDAFQNLLTNVKNYPIVDIDYVAEDDTDELHGDYVWENYTSGIPCIKITYGDDRTTKGNVIFAEEQRDLINKYKKILNQLRVTQNEYERLKNRWEKIYALNYQVYTEKQNQILRYKARFASTEVNKLAFLKAGWSLLQYNLVELFNPEINDVRTPLLKASNPEKFEYQEFLGPDNFDYEKVLLPDHENNTVTHNLEYIVLNEEQKGKIIDTLTTFRDILIDDGENESYFFTENERNTINSFINFIASFNYFSVLEAIGLAGYHYTSDQILIIKNNKVQINDSNRVAAFEPVGASASFNSDTSYYTPEYYTIYINIGDADYNNENTYYLLNSDLSYSQYTYTTEADFNANRHLLYLKRQELFCYRLVTGLNATTFNNQRDNLYIQSSNSETIQSAVKAILPQIVDDIVWENLNNINLNFDSVYYEFSANIENIVNTLNSIVNPRLEIIEEELARYINILNTTEFTFEDESTITVSADEENIYISSPETEDTIIANHLLDGPEAIKLKVQIINKIIANCNQLVEEIATGKKDKNGNLLEDGNNRILYGYKYVKVGSNITFDHNLGDAVAAVKESYEAQYPGYTYPEVNPDNGEAQRTGTFRIDINGHTYEIGIQGLVGGGEGDIHLSTGGNIYLTPSDDGDPSTIGYVYINGNLEVDKNTKLDQNLEVVGTTKLDQNLEVVGTTQLDQGLLVLGTTQLNNDTMISGDLLPGEDNKYNIGMLNAYNIVSEYDDNIDYYCYGYYPLTVDNYKNADRYYTVNYQNAYARVRASAGNNIRDPNTIYYVCDETSDLMFRAAGVQFINGKFVPIPISSFSSEEEDNIYYFSTVEKANTYINNETYYDRNCIKFEVATPDNTWYNKNETYYTYMGRNFHSANNTFYHENLQYYRITGTMGHEQIYTYSPIDLSGTYTTGDVITTGNGTRLGDILVGEIQYKIADPQPANSTELYNGNYYIMTVDSSKTPLFEANAYNFEHWTYYTDKYKICNPQPTVDNFPTQHRYYVTYTDYIPADPQPNTQEELNNGIYSTYIENYRAIYEPYHTTLTDADFGEDNPTYYGYGYYLADPQPNSDTDFSNNIYYQEIGEQLRWKNLYLTGNIGSADNPITSIYAVNGNFDTCTYRICNFSEGNIGDGTFNKLKIDGEAGYTGQDQKPTAIDGDYGENALSCKGGAYFAKNLSALRVYNAVFNDYAECRTTIDLAPGHVVVDNDDGSLSCSSQRLQPGAQVISDTFGNLMGETDTAKTPLAVAGRVLVYTYRPREEYHAGMAVCSAPNGTIDIMTREEIRDYPDCIIGIVSEIPQYKTWGSDNVDVNGRIWIKVK